MEIYCITGPTGRKYFGKTHKTTQSRWKRHIQDAHKGVGCKALQRAILKYGLEAFTVEAVARFDSPETLNLAEQLFIAEFNTLAPEGYNLTRGGDGGGGPKDAEHRRKISEGLKRQSACPQGHIRFAINNRGHRRCMECNRIRENVRYASL